MNFWLSRFSIYRKNLSNSERNISINIITHVIYKNLLVLWKELVTRSIEGLSLFPMGIGSQMISNVHCIMSIQFDITNIILRCLNLHQFSKCQYI